MQFEFKNLGTIKEAQLEMGDLTIICGENNTGKTYLTYAVWGILDVKQLSNLNVLTTLLQTGEFEKFYNCIGKSKMTEDLDFFYINVTGKNWKEMLSKINELHRKNIRSLFVASLDSFEELELLVLDLNNMNFSSEILPIELSVNKGKSLNIKIEKSRMSEAFKEFKEQDIKASYLQFIYTILVAFQSYDKSVFILPAQRDSIELFYKALDEHNAHTLKELQRTKDMSLLEESPRFPQPIEKLIDFARDLTRQVIKTESFIQKEYPELLQEIEDILGVKYEVLGDEVVIKDGSARLPAYMASTSVRSLMHLYFWLKHKAQKGDLLMIDEPELNLHPKNQIKMARLFAKLINVGVKIWITTHSDYIIKELNNCLMLSQDFENKEEMIEKLGYKSNEILKQEQIKAYIAKYDEILKGCTVVPVEYDDYGMVMTTFDEQIDQINAISEQLSDAIYDKKLSKEQQIN
jgi:predicted ATPase